MMNYEHFNTLSEAVDYLTKEGYIENFETKEGYIVANYSKSTYQPEELKIVKTFRFEGMTNPDDATLVFALVAVDGKKGTLVMSYGAMHNHDTELIKRIAYL